MERAVDEHEHEIYRDIMRRLFVINRLHHASIESRTEELSLHRSQHMMLVTIESADEALTQRELSERLDISPSAVAMTLRRLLVGGYVYRTPDASDARCNKISLTDRGRQALAKTKELFDSVDRAVFAGFSEQQLEQLASLLDRMCSNLRGIAPPDALEPMMPIPPEGDGHGGRVHRCGKPHGGSAHGCKPHDEAYGGKTHGGELHDTEPRDGDACDEKTHHGGGGDGFHG